MNLVVASTAERRQDDWLRSGHGWLRLTRFAITFAGVFALLLLPQLFWALLRPGVPSPFARWFLRSLAAAAGLRVTVTGAGLERRALIVANHISWSDILALGGVTRTAFVARADVRQWPIFGLLARLNATIFVDRAARFDVRDQGAAVADALGRGRVALFPEGTTGDGSEVLPFRPALLAAAGEHAVQPVAIAYGPRDGGCWRSGGLAAFAWTGDKPFLPHIIQVIASGGAQCCITVLPPIARGDRKTRAAAARQMIGIALGKPAPVRFDTEPSLRP